MAGLLTEAWKFVERRASTRKRVSIPGLIDRGLLGPISCTVTDYSMGGAQLRFERRETVASLPARFTLRISRASGTAVACEVRWRQLLSVGVEYIKNTKRDR